MIFDRIISWWRNRRYFVIADPADSGVTLSRSLYKHIADSAPAGASARVFVFYIPFTKCYGFMLNPPIETPTQLCSIQYNEKYRCVGFETLCPTISRIFYDYGISGMKPCKLTVTVHRDMHNQSYYQIERPHEKFIAKQPPR